MIFSSFTFLLFFMPLTILLYWVAPAKARMPLLFAASLLFYGWSNPLWLLLLAFSMVLNWGGAQLMIDPWILYHLNNQNLHLIILQNKHLYSYHLQFPQYWKNLLLM